MEEGKESRAMKIREATAESADATLEASARALRADQRRARANVSDDKERMHAVRDERSARMTCYCVTAVDAPAPEPRPPPPPPPPRGGTL